MMSELETALNKLKEKEKLYDREHQRLCGLLATCKLTLEESVERINAASSEIFKDGGKVKKLKMVQSSLAKDLDRMQRECTEINKAYGHVFERMAIREQLVRETGLVGFQMENTRDTIIAKEMTQLNEKVDKIKTEIDNVTQQLTDIQEREENIVKLQEEYDELLARSQKYEEERRLAAIRLHECQSLVLEIERKLKSPMKVSISLTNEKMWNDNIDQDDHHNDKSGNMSSVSDSMSDESSSPLVYRNKKEVPLEGFTSSHYMTFSKHVSHK